MKHPKLHNNNSIIVVLLPMSLPLRSIALYRLVSIQLWRSIQTYQLSPNNIDLLPDDIHIEVKNLTHICYQSISDRRKLTKLVINHPHLVKTLLQYHQIQLSPIELDDYDLFLASAKSGCTELFRYLSERPQLQLLTHRQQLELLLNAIESRNDQLIDWIFNRYSIDPNEKCDGHINSALLCETARQGNERFFDNLIYVHGCDPYNHIIPLAIVESGNVDFLIRYIQNYHPDLNTLQEDIGLHMLGHTAIHIATAKGYENMTKYLIEQCHVPLTPTTLYNFTVLHTATHGGNLNIVRYLIEQKHFDPSIVTNDNVSILHTSALSGNCELLDYLIETYHLDPFAKSPDGWSLLHFAIQGQSIELFRHSIEDYHVNPHDNEMSLLFCCIKHGNKKCLRYLIESCHINPCVDAFRQRTLLEVCARFSQKRIIKYLITTHKFNLKSVSNALTTTIENDRKPDDEQIINLLSLYIINLMCQSHYKRYNLLILFLFLFIILGLESFALLTLMCTIMS
jgi:ankyrin repeat protein